MPSDSLVTSGPEALASSSIPAAVISMALLSAVRDSSILENNIVQTVASAAGTLSAIIFVLPGLVIVGWWVGFPFWETFQICVAGGVLGVLFTIPLRRALVTHSDLPYPEGVAAAEVLRVGSSARGEDGASAGEAREGLTAVILGSVASAGLAIATGSDASEDRDANAMAWAGARKATNTAGRMRPRIIPNGYSMTAAATTVMSTTSPT